MITGATYKITDHGKKHSVLGYDTIELITRRFSHLRIIDLPKSDSHREGNNVWAEYQWIIKVSSSNGSIYLDNIAEDELFEELSSVYDYVEEKE